MFFDYGFKSIKGISSPCTNPSLKYNAMNFLETQGRFQIVYFLIKLTS